MCRPADVHGGSTLRVVLGAVDVGPRRRVQNEVDLASRSRVRQRPGDVPVGAREREDVVVRECPLERAAELAAGARDQDSTAASRADRIGVLELHRDATRGSFQGTVCSSGSAGSYSAVTW